MSQSEKRLPAIQETWDWCLGQEDPLEKQWLPTLVFLLEEFQGQRSLLATVHRVTKSHRVTKTQLSDFHFHFRCLYISTILTSLLTLATSATFSSEQVARFSKCSRKKMDSSAQSLIMLSKSCLYLILPSISKA